MCGGGGGGGREKFCNLLFVSSDQIASQGVHCLLLHLQLLDAVPYCNLPNCFIFRTVMIINLGIQFFRCFTVIKFVSFYYTTLTRNPKLWREIFYPEQGIH